MRRRPREFRKTIEKDRALERRFQAVKVEPPTEDEALEIIRGIVERYEAFHQIRYSKDALAAAVYQSNRYIADRFLPDKAIDVLDEAGARAKLRYQSENGGEPSWKETVENWKRAAANEDQLISYELRSLEDSFFAVEVTKDDVDEVIARWTGVPVSSVKQEEAEKLLNIETALHKRIVSQRPAISALARAIRRSRAGLKNPQQPVGSFLFLGPTGVGKTEVARIARRIPVRLGTRADPLRHERIHGETLGLEIHRLASGIRRPRRRRPVDRKASPLTLRRRAF